MNELTIPKEEGIEAAPPWRREVLRARPWSPKVLEWRQGKVRLGVDLGSYAIKAVLVQGSSKGARLLSFALVELPEEAGDPRGAQLQALAEALEDLRLKGVEVVTSVDSSRAIIKQLTLPTMSRKELEQAVPWEARRYIPFALDEVALDYQVLRMEKGARDMDVLLVAVPKELVETHLELLQERNLAPSWTNVNSLALMNASLAKGDLQPGETLVLIDLGTENTTLNVYREGEEGLPCPAEILGDLSPQLSLALGLVLCG